MLKIILLTLGLVALANAHMSIWVPSMWGSEPGNPNANWAVQPLQDLSFNDWWWHGAKSRNDPPPPNVITELPAGGTYDFEITGNKRFTSMGDGLWHAPGRSPRDIPDPWSNDMNGGSSNIHAPTHADVAGCALGIAYKSDMNSVQPSDFVIMSVVHDCIARQLQAFDIPALPACPGGKCICGWFWIHNSIGGTDQMYMTAFQCNVTNPSKKTIIKPVAPVRCDGQKPCYLYPNWGNTTKVCPKSLNPMYWANAQGNNMPMPTNWQCAPTYNTYYGFPDGAQHQIFTDSENVAFGSIGDVIRSGDVISSSAGSFMLSPHGHTKLAVQENGELVLSDARNGRVYWSTNTAGQGVGPYYLVVGEDGVLALKDSKSAVLWHSDTAAKGVAPYRLKLKDVVSLKLVDSNSSPVWEPEYAL